MYVVLISSDIDILRAVNPDVRSFENIVQKLRWSEFMKQHQILLLLSGSLWYGTELSYITIFLFHYSENMHDS